MPTIKKYTNAVRDFKRKYWMELMIETGGNVSRAAKLSGFNRCAIYKLLKQLDVPFQRSVQYGPGNWGDLSNSGTAELSGAVRAAPVG